MLQYSKIVLGNFKKFSPFGAVGITNTQPVYKRASDGVRIRNLETFDRQNVHLFGIIKVWVKNAYIRRKQKGSIGLDPPHLSVTLKCKEESPVHSWFTKF
ncbi:hypothetical protein NQ317_018963 [Molorchus minor]|uniref:Uncharacterized protein n=1 Tax=Molorchus minor TaxID=1323400 RepID=A0ABQ9JL28_9CUCU|nr:hypothetical protein NQ317_018963 [Molorchus minor]